MWASGATEKGSGERAHAAVDVHEHTSSSEIKESPVTLRDGSLPPGIPMTIYPTAVLSADVAERAKKEGTIAQPDREPHGDTQGEGRR